MTEPLDDRRLDELVDLIVQLASGDLSARLEPSPARDSVDAVITGINLLADELDMMYQTLEERVVERTAMLDQAKRELERLALYDALTGLANRTLLGDRIGQALGPRPTRWTARRACCCWTWTSSRRSTTGSGTAPATGSWSRSPAG